MLHSDAVKLCQYYFYPVTCISLCLSCKKNLFESLNDEENVANDELNLEFCEDCIFIYHFLPSSFILLIAIFLFFVFTADLDSN